MSFLDRSPERLVPVIVPLDAEKPDGPMVLRRVIPEELLETVKNSSNICDDCPRMKSLLVRKQELVNKGLGPCETVVFDGALETLEQAAGEIACQLFDKNLPAPEEPVPPLGAERTAYEKRCLASDKYNELRRVNDGY